MKSNKIVFLKLHLKKALKLFPSILLITAITLAGIFIAAYALLSRSSSSPDRAMSKVAIVGDRNDSYLGIGIGAVKSFDESKDYLDISSMTEEEALSALKSRKINGYLSLPDEFIDDIVTGKNTPAQFVYMDGPRGLGTVILHEIVEGVSTFVTQTQTAVYTLRASMREIHSLEKPEGTAEADAEFAERLEDETLAINLDFFSLVINRNKLFKLDYTGSVAELSYGAYYLCALIVIFLLIWGMSCNRMLAHKNFDFSRLIGRKGIDCKLQILYESLSFITVTFFILFAAAAVMGLFLTNTDTGIRELEDTDVSSALLFILKSFPPIVTVAVMHIMIYEIFSNPISALLSEFLLAIGLSYISGCLYPISFFPESVQKISAFLPSGAAFSYLRKLISGSNPVAELLLCMLYTAIFYTAAVLIRKIKITGESK